MSRNIRHKQNLASPKKTARRVSKTSDDSSDEDYAGVDLISDSEEDEPDVEVAEEQAIIESAEDEEEEDDDDSVSTPRPSAEDDQSNWDGFSVDTSQDVLDDDFHFFEDHMSRMHAPDHDIEATVWASKNIGSGSPEPRRVRFHLSDSSSTASDNDDIYPDLFMDQDSLAPSFRKRIENDDDEQHPSSEDGSYWDFDGDRDPTRESDEGSESGSSTGSSGYETDSGDTTEEEEPPESIRKERYLPPRSVLRRQSTDSGSEEEITINRRIPPRAMRGPRLGSWIHNASRPFAVINSDGNRLYMFKARVNRRYSHGDMHPHTHLISGLESESETPGDHTTPMVSNSGNLMLSAMYTPFAPYLSNLGDSHAGPPEAFYPRQFDENGELIHGTPSSLEEDDVDIDVDVDVDDEELWDVEDFINFGEESSDEEGDEEGPLGTPRPTTASSEDQVHSNLLNPGIVGAFRKNQQKHKLMTRYNATVDSLVFAGPYAATTIRGIKDGRIAHAATAITPLRKQKAPPIESSPLAAHSAKRKFSGEERGHKRSKSMN